MNRGFCYTLLSVMLLCTLLHAGCIQAQSPEPQYNVDEKGMLHITPATPVFEEQVLDRKGNVTLRALTMHDLDTTVYAILATPDQPVAGLVFVPGAGVPAEGHMQRAREYAEQGIAFLILDVRGNGGKTPGYPFSITDDYHRFKSGSWPQIYAVVLDIMESRRIVAERYAVPVYAAGESRGGMYAALAAAADPGFAGYFGVSTGGYDEVGNRYTGDAARFLKSVDPEYAVAQISPRPVFVLHALPDTIIPFADGQRLAVRAGNAGQFVPFNGTHGMNGEADRIITGTILTF